MSMHSSLFTVHQAVGYHNCGKQDVDVHLLKPSLFLPDPEYVITPSMIDNVIQDDCLAPGQDYITYTYSTSPNQAGRVDWLQSQS